MKRYINAWKHALDFKGRANRSDYLVFHLFYFILIFLLAFIEAMLGSQEMVASSLFQLLSLIPWLSLSVRRLHDMDYVGWWLLFPASWLFLMFIEGTNTNRFGGIPN